MTASTNFTTAPALTAPVSPPLIRRDRCHEGKGDCTWAIDARHVDMRYSSGDEAIHVLKDVSLRVKRGDIQLLMGPSGSGKTTLLSILAGILTPTSGHVDLLGQAITQLSPKQLANFRLQNIGFVFQGFNLFPALSAAENVEVALNLKGIRGPQAKKMARKLLDRVALSHRADHLPKVMSGGEKQRVAIARALAGHPPLILADEPTAALDSRNGHGVMELLRSLAKEDGSTIVIVTHDLRIMDIADRVAHLEDGELSN
ncbi:ABC transporter ATP-binding protein [Limnothrix redekei LRLZ20PSL1]|uniref:ABC transporter ATP-binding protein n=2 Tax=Limnothrix TaxID=132605 RepID=A0ABW7CEZ0_9CYAN